MNLNFYDTWKFYHFLLWLKVNIGPNGGVIKFPINEKRLVVERNGVKCATPGNYSIDPILIIVTHIWRTFDLVAVKVVLWSFGALVSHGL